MRFVRTKSKISRSSIYRILDVSPNKKFAICFLKNIPIPKIIMRKPHIRKSMEKKSLATDLPLLDERYRTTAVSNLNIAIGTSKFNVTMTWTQTAYSIAPMVFAIRGRKIRLLNRKIICVNSLTIISTINFWRVKFFSLYLDGSWLTFIIKLFSYVYKNLVGSFILLHLWGVIRLVNIRSYPFNRLHEII